MTKQKSRQLFACPQYADLVRLSPVKFH